MAIDPFLPGSLTAAFPANASGSAAGLALPDEKMWRARAWLPQTNTSVQQAQEVYRDVGEPAWLGKLTSSTRRLESLEAGWDGPGSTPVSKKALFLATHHTRLALEPMEGVSAPHLVPGGDGSIQVEWHAKHGELELDIDARGRMSIWIRDHRNGAEFDGEGEAALALFYRWAPWIASELRDAADAVQQAQVALFAIAA